MSNGPRNPPIGDGIALSAGAPTPRYVIVTIGKLRLLLPQPHIYALEPALDVEPITGVAVGQIRVENVHWPVYCLSEALTPIRTIPISRRICALLRIDSGLFGLLCDQLALSQWHNGLAILPLPDCMRTPASRLRGLAIQGKEVLGVVSAEDLHACIGVEGGSSHHTNPDDIIATEILS
jgi:hypothetical protein